MIVGKLSLTPRIVIADDSHLQTATVTIGILLGSRNERVSKYGLVHLLEHMIFRGSLTHPSKRQLLEPLVDVAAKFNGGTERDLTVYFATVLAEDLYVALDVLIEMVKQPLLDANDLQIEKQAVINEIKSNDSVPSRKLLSRMLLPNVLLHFPEYSHDVTGTIEDVNNASQQDLVQLVTSAYGDPDKIVISVNCNLNEISGQQKYLEKTITELWHRIPYSYASRPSGATSNYVTRPTAHSGGATASAANYISTASAAPETFVALGWISAAFESYESYVLDWISAYLTGTLLSVLYLRLREQTGYVYHVSSEQYDLDRTGVFVIAWQIAKPDRVNETTQIIQEELSKLKQFNDRNQLTKWQKWIVRRFRMNMQDSSFLATLYTQQMLLRNGIRKVDDIVDLYSQITCRDIQRVSRQVFQTQAQTLAAIYPN